MHTLHQLSLAEAQAALTAEALAKIAIDLRALRARDLVNGGAERLATALEQHARDLRELPPF